MKLCTKCRKNVWPYGMVILVAGVAGYLTWLTLVLSDVGITERAIASGGVFLAVGGTLVHYVIACMRRHCHHEKELAPRP